MAGGGRTYYATGTGRFSRGKEIRADQSSVAEATRKGELRIKTSFGTTTKAPQGTMSKEQLLKVLRSGDTVKFGDGTSVKVSAANKLATINRLVSEGQRQITPAPAQTGPVIGGQFRGQPTAAPKPPAATPKATPRGQPKPATKPTGKPTTKPSGRGAPRPAGKPAGRPTPKPAAKPAVSQKAVRKGGEKGGKKGQSAQPKKGGASGGKTRTSRPQGKGVISSAGVLVTGNRRKGGGGKKDRKAKRLVKKRKGGRSGRGRSK
jgi:translation initiation factor IF-2